MLFCYNKLSAVSHFQTSTEILRLCPFFQSVDLTQAFPANNKVMLQPILLIFKPSQSTFNQLINLQPVLSLLHQSSTETLQFHLQNLNPKNDAWHSQTNTSVRHAMANFAYWSNVYVIKTHTVIKFILIHTRTVCVGSEGVSFVIIRVGLYKLLMSKMILVVCLSLNT